MATFKQLMERAKRAPKKNLAMGFACIAGIIGMIIFMIVWFL